MFGSHGPSLECNENLIFKLGDMREDWVVVKSRSLQTVDQSVFMT